MGTDRAERDCCDPALHDHRCSKPVTVDVDARKVEVVHAEKTTVPAGLAAHLDHLHTERLAHLQQMEHIHLENNILFPRALGW